MKNSGMRMRRLILLLGWLLSLAAISRYGGAVSYGLFFGVTLIPVISFLYILCVYFRFRIFQRMESRKVVCGQAVPYYFVLKNDDLFSFSGISVKLYSSFSYVEDLPDDMEYELTPGDSYRYDTRLVCRYRGEYEVGVKEILVTDFFHLFRIRYAVPEAIKATVLPKIPAVAELRSIADLTALLHREAISEKTERDIVVRDYMEGDPLRQIHWKATAREQKLMTRRLTGEEKWGISVFFDTKRCDAGAEKYLPVENKILETVLALGFFFSGKNMPVSVYYSQGGVRKSAVEGMKSFEGFYQEICGVVFDEREDGGLFLETLMDQGELTSCKVAFGIFHELNDRIMEHTERLSAGGAVTILYVITDEDIHKYMRLCSPRRKIVAVPSQGELEGVL